MRPIALRRHPRGARPRAAGALVALALLAAASCGGGADGDGGADGPAPPPSLAAAPRTSAPTTAPAATAPTTATTSPATTAPVTTAAPTTSEAPVPDTAPAEPAPTAPPPAPPPPAEAGPVEVAAGGAEGYTFSASPITEDLAARMNPTSWRPGCPVGLEELRYLTVAHWGFDGAVHQGELVVHADVVADLEGIFRDLFVAGFPIWQMRLVDDFGGDDHTSIEANNTSAFNCRAVEGTDRWSNHAYGRAIDINPIENPYVYGDGTTSHPASVPFLDRADVRAGMIVKGGPVVAAFDARGWDWGGRWYAPVDHQHLSRDGG